MRKNKKAQSSQHADMKENQTSAIKNDVESSPMYADQPLPYRLSKNIPAKLNYNDNPPDPESGMNEPEKNVPTRIDEEPPIFNYY